MSPMAQQALRISRNAALIVGVLVFITFVPATWLIGEYLDRDIPIDPFFEGD